MSAALCSAYRKGTKMIQTSPDTRVRIKQIAALGLTAGLLLTGCGRTMAPRAARRRARPLQAAQLHGTINLWAQGGEAKLLPELVKDFETENPGVKVNVTAIPGTRHTTSIRLPSPEAPPRTLPRWARPG